MCLSFAFGNHAQVTYACIIIYTYIYIYIYIYMDVLLYVCMFVCWQLCAFNGNYGFS